MTRLKEFGAWSEQTSSSGKRYYYNRDTEVSQWEKPAEWKEHEKALLEMYRSSRSSSSKSSSTKLPSDSTTKTAAQESGARTLSGAGGVCSLVGSGHSSTEKLASGGHTANVGASASSGSSRAQPGGVGCTSSSAMGMASAGKYHHHHTASYTSTPAKVSSNNSSNAFGSTPSSATVGEKSNFGSSSSTAARARSGASSGNLKRSRDEDRSSSSHHYSSQHFAGHSSAKNACLESGASQSRNAAGEKTAENSESSPLRFTPLPSSTMKTSSRVTTTPFSGHNNHNASGNSNRDVGYAGRSDARGAGENWDRDFATPKSSTNGGAFATSGFVTLSSSSPANLQNTCSRDTFSKPSPVSMSSPHSLPTSASKAIEGGGASAMRRTPTSQMTTTPNTSTMSAASVATPNSSITGSTPLSRSAGGSASSKRRSITHPTASSSITAASDSSTTTTTMTNTSTTPTTTRQPVFAVVAPVPVAPPLFDETRYASAYRADLCGYRRNWSSDAYTTEARRVADLAAKQCVALEAVDDDVRSVRALMKAADLRCLLVSQKLAFVRTQIAALETRNPSA